VEYDCSKVTHDLLQNLSAAITKKSDKDQVPLPSIIRRQVATDFEIIPNTAYKLISLMEQSFARIRQKVMSSADFNQNIQTLTEDFSALVGLVRLQQDVGYSKASEFIEKNLQLFDPQRLYSECRLNLLFLLVTFQFSSTSAPSSLSSRHFNSLFATQRSSFNRKVQDLKRIIQFWINNVNQLCIVPEKREELSELNGITVVSFSPLDINEETRVSPLPKPFG